MKSHVTLEQHVRAVCGAKAMIRALLPILAVASLAWEAQAQQPKPQPPQTVRCIKDSFGNYTCTDGTRVIHDGFDNPIVIPPGSGRGSSGHVGALRERPTATLGPGGAVAGSAGCPCC